MALSFNNKVENQGATSAGRLTAEEFNALVSQVNLNEANLQSTKTELDELKKSIDTGGDIIVGDVTLERISETEIDEMFN